MIVRIAVNVPLSHNAHSPRRLPLPGTVPLHYQPRSRLGIDEAIPESLCLTASLQGKDTHAHIYDIAQCVEACRD